MHPQNNPYVLPTVVFIAYNQVMMKWRITAFGEFPSNNWDKLNSFIKTFSDPFIVSGIVAAVIAVLTWLAAITKVPLNVRFPIYYGLTFALVISYSSIFLHEPVPIVKMIGIGLILTGVVVGSIE